MLPRLTLRSIVSRVKAISGASCLDTHSDRLKIQSRFLIVGLVLLVSLVESLVCHALTDEEVYREFRFNFINPGGRSLAMGGAFISIADDATAAQANPAGLENLQQPEFFAEIRYAEVDATVVRLTEPDPVAGFDIAVETVPDSLTTPSFLSYVWMPKRKEDAVDAEAEPTSSATDNDVTAQRHLRVRDRVRIGFSRQEVLNARSSVTSQEEFLFGSQTDRRTSQGNLDIALVNWNFSVAYLPTRIFSFGITLSYAQLELQSRLVNTYQDPTGDIIGDPALADVPLEMYRTEANGSDTDVTVTAGLLLTPIDQFGIGAVYRQGGTFQVDQRVAAQNINRDLVPGRVVSILFFNETETILNAQNNAFVVDNVLKVPDIGGVGFMYRPMDTLVFSLDAVYTAWSDLLVGFNSRLNLLTIGWPTEADASFTVEDQTNIHFGAEYELPLGRVTKWKIRAGFHQEKDNRIRADFPNGDTGFGLANNGIFPGGEDENHASVGFGVVSGQHFQFDLGIDGSRTSVEAVGSLIYRF